MDRPLKVLLAGESWITQTTHIKGIDSFTQYGYGEGTTWLRRAVERGGHIFQHLPSHLALTGFPTTVGDLQAYDVLVLSDIGANTLLLHPDTTQHSMATGNRLETIRDYVAEGGALIMVGGYMSFQGIEGKARYHGTPIEEVLPVTMLRGIDDRVEMPQGFRPLAAERSAHPILSGIPPTFPTMLFYNRVELKPEATLLLQYDRDPILAVWDYKRGRTAAFTPDVAPHGATPEFLDWKYFDQFWLGLLDWLTHRS